MAVPLLVVLVSLVAAANAAQSLHYSDCSVSPNKIAHIENGHISVDPVHIPGPEVVDVDLQLLQPISGHHYIAHVHLQKHTFLGYIGVPCLNNVGSCDYDLCDLLSGVNYNNTHHCPLQIAQSSPDFPCSCPFAVGNYHLNPSKFDIPELAGVWTFLATGEYKAHLTVTNNVTKEEVFCYDAHVKLDADCSGLGCIFG